MSRGICFRACFPIMNLLALCIAVVVAVAVAAVIMRWTATFGIPYIYTDISHVFYLYPVKSISWVQYGNDYG